jgi:hypothetical protein
MSKCPVAQSEIDRDTGTDRAEAALFVAEEERWISIVNDLLAGKTVNENGFSVSLSERMADQYQEFADFVDIDFDFMQEFKSGKFCGTVNELFWAEAKTLASIVVG